MLYEYGHQYFILKHSNVSLSLLELELWKLAVSIHSKDWKTLVKGILFLESLWKFHSVDVCLPWG